MSKFYKNLQMELTAKINWEFTDRIKQEIWQEDKDDELRKESYKNNENVVWGWQLEANPIFKSFEKVQREHTFDYLDSYYIQLRFAYNYWKQYEHEWNLKYKDYIK